jgi:hypothetical protein
MIVFSGIKFINSGVGRTKGRKLMNEAGEAMVTVTVGGQQGDFGPVRFDATDADIKRWAAEAVTAGVVAGVDAQSANFDDTVVERFAARDGLPDRLMLRPKMPVYGCVQHAAHGVRTPNGSMEIFKIKGRRATLAYSARGYWRVECDGLTVIRELTRAQRAAAAGDIALWDRLMTDLKADAIAAMRSLIRAAR